MVLSSLRKLLGGESAATRPESLQVLCGHTLLLGRQLCNLLLSSRNLSGQLLGGHLTYPSGWINAYSQNYVSRL